MKKFAVMAASLSAAVLAGSLMTSAAAQTIKIGVIEPLTGPFAASGNYVTNGAKIAADEINAKGGVLGQKIELVIEDNKSNPTEAASVAEKLMVRDKVPVLMGAWGSSLTLAVMPKLMEYKVPMLVETSSSGKITTSGNPYIFRISPPSAVEAVAFAKIVDKLHIKKADFLVINNDWGLGTAQDFSKMFKEHGITVGLVETMDQAAQDMSAQLVQVQEFRCRYVDRDQRGRAAHARVQTGGGARLEEADHHHRRLAKSRSADRSGRYRGQRHDASHHVRAVGARGVAGSGSDQELHRGMEEARLPVRRRDRKLPWL